jgi:TolA-binding protein
MAERGYVVLSGTIGGQYARGSIVPPKAFEEDRINHWIARGVIRRANEDDVEAAKGIQPSGSLLDTGSRVEAPSPTEAVHAQLAAKHSEIGQLRARIESLEEEVKELEGEELSRAKEQEEAVKKAAEAEGRALERDPREPHPGNPAPEASQSSNDPPTPVDAEPDTSKPAETRSTGRVTR